MGWFNDFTNKYPFTDFHELNLSWFLDEFITLKEYVKTFYKDFSDKIEEEVNSWLDEHPEATTTVEDGAITYAKLNSDINSGFVLDNGTYKYDYNELVNNPFVTPQMYGAKGDGVTDDTQAIQDAIDNNTGGTVFFPTGVYLVTSTLKTYKSKDKFTNLILASDAVLKANASMEYLLDIGGYSETFDFEVGYKKYINGGKFDSNRNIARSTIMVRSDVKDVDISNTVILTNGNSGLTLGETTGTSQDAYIHHITIENDRSIHIGNGLVINSSDNNLNCIRVYYFGNDIVVNGSAIFLSDIHTLAHINNSDTRTSFLINSQLVFISNSYGDSTENFIKVTASNAKVFVSQCEYYSYGTNKLTAFDLGGEAVRLKVDQFFMLCPALNSGKHTGIKVDSFTDFTLKTANHFISLSDITIDNAEYLRNGDILKGGQAKNGYITLLPTVLTQDKWFKVGTFQWTNTANSIYYLEFSSNGRQTKLPITVNIKSDGTLTYDLHSAKVQSDDTANYKIGFVGAVDGEFGTIDVYLLCSSATSRTLQQFKFLSSQAAFPSTNTSRPRQLDVMGDSFAPTIKFDINCSSGTIGLSS